MSPAHTAGPPDSATEPDYRNYGYYSGRFRQKPARILTDLKVGSINSIFYFLHKTAEPFNCLEQDNLA